MDSFRKERRIVRQMSPVLRDKTIAFSMFLAGLSCFALLYYLQPLLPLLSQTFSLSMATSSLSMSFTTIGMAVGLFVGMFSADTVGRKKVIVGSLFLASLAGVVSSWVTTFYLLVILSAVKGFFLSGAASVSLAYINEEVTDRNKGKVTGLYIAGGAVGGMSGRVISAYLGATYSWDIASLVVSLLCSVFVFVILWKSPWSRNFTPRRKTFKSLFVSNLQLLTDRVLLTYCFVGALMMGVFVSLYNYVGFYLDKPPFGFSSAYIKNIYLLYVLGLIGSVGIDFLYRFFTKNRLLIIVLCLSALGLLLMYVASIYAVTFGLGLITMGFFITHVVCSYLISNINPQKRSVAIAVYLLLYYAMSSFWGWASGVILGNFGWQYFLLTLLCVVLFILVLMLRLIVGRRSIFL